MTTIIIEDEQIAVQNLTRLISDVAPDITVQGVLQSVEETIEYFSRPVDIDLVFMDIHLADGLAFNIFDSVTITCPIIFTTAYDQYALEAFKVNSIDYLLKPIDKDELARAIAKYRRLSSSQSQQPLTPETVASIKDLMLHHKYKSYFLIPLRDKLVPLNIADIAYIYLDDKISRVVTLSNQVFPIDKPLDALFAQLDPTLFFRANRQYIIAHKAVSDIAIWPLSKLHVTLSTPTPDKVIISRARSTEFKDWYTN